MQTRNRFLETSTRLSSRSSRFSSAKFLAGCDSSSSPEPTIVDADIFVLDVLEFFFRERLSPTQLNNSLRELASLVLYEAIKASDSMDFIPRPGGVPSVGWLVGQAVQIGFRKLQREQQIYEIVRSRIQINFRTSYEEAKAGISTGQSYRPRAQNKWSTAKDQAADDQFVLDVLQFFFDERLSTGQLNDHLRRLAAYALSEAINASRAMDFVPRPPSLPPTINWLIGQAVQIAVRRILQDRSIYEAVRVTVKLKLKTEYQLAKQGIEGALSFRRGARSFSNDGLHLSEQGKLFMAQFPASTAGDEDLRLVETAVASSAATVQLNQNQFDALVSFCSSITSAKYLASTLVTVLNTPYPSEAERNTKVAEEIRKWKLIAGNDDPDSISRRGAEADLFTSGSYSGASSVFRSYAAFARAKALPRVSRAQNPAVIVAAVGVGWQVFKGLIDNKGDIAFDLAKMDGQKSPFDDEAKYKSKAIYQEKTFTVTQETHSAFGLLPMSADFEVKYKYNGYAVGYISMQYLRGQDAVGWGLDVKADIMVDPNSYSRSDGESMAAVDISLNYRFSTNLPFRDDDVWIGAYKIYGDGRMIPNTRWSSAP